MKIFVRIEIFKEALEAFFEECEMMGTLEDALEESGFSKTTRYKNLPKAGSRDTYSHKYDNSRDGQGTIL